MVTAFEGSHQHILMFGHASGRLWAPFVVRERMAYPPRNSTLKRRRKNCQLEVWTYLQPFKGHDLAHIRVFTLGNDDEMYPTKQGITVKVSDLPKLAEAMAALVAAVEARQS